MPRKQQAHQCKVFFVKDRIDKGEFKVMYCPKRLMLADYLPIPLVVELFKEIRNMIMSNKAINNMNPISLDKIKERVGILYEK